MTITATTLIRDINLETLPTAATRERIVALPDAPPLAHPTPDLPENKVTLGQQRLIATYAQRNMDQALTWAETVKQLRAKYLRGAQPDFQIATSIMAELRKANEKLDLTEAQVTLVHTMLAALSGSQRHWCEPIAKAIDATPPARREKCLGIFMDVMFGNQGQLNRAMQLSEALFGRVPNRPALGDPVLAGATGETTESVDSTGADEPY